MIEPPMTITAIAPWFGGNVGRGVPARQPGLRSAAGRRGEAQAYFTR